MGLYEITKSCIAGAAPANIHHKNIFISCQNRTKVFFCSFNISLIMFQNDIFMIKEECLDFLFVIINRTWISKFLQIIIFQIINEIIESRIFQDIRNRFIAAHLVCIAADDTVKQIIQIPFRCHIHNRITGNMNVFIIIFFKEPVISLPDNFAIAGAKQNFIDMLCFAQIINVLAETYG